MQLSVPKLFLYACSAFLLCVNIYAGQSSPSGNYSQVEYRVDSCLRIRDFKKALYLVDLYQQLTKYDDRSYAASLLKTGEIKFVQGDIGSGNDWLEKAEKTMHRVRVEDKWLNFRYSYLKGRYCFFMGRNSEAMQWFHRAESLARYIGNTCNRELAGLYSEMGHTLLQEKDYAGATRYYQYAIAIYPENSLVDRHEGMRLKASLAEVSMWQGDIDRYSRLIQPCLEYLGRLSDPLHPALLEIYLSVNNLVYKVEDIKGVIRADFLQYATTILNDFYPPDHYLAVILYSQKGMIEYARSNYANALHYSSLALQINKKYAFLDFYLDQDYGIVAPSMLVLEPDRNKVIGYCEQVAAELQQTGLSPSYMFYIQSLAFQAKKDTNMIINSLNRMITFS